MFKGVSDALSPYVLGAAAEGETQELINYGVLGGIVMGLVAALLLQKYYRIKLPAYLAFFGGRRFVPIVTAGMAIVIAVIGALIYPVFDAGLTAVGDWVTGSTIIGAFVYGTANRLLVPDRPAPPAQLAAVVPVRRVHRRQRRGVAGRHRRASSTVTRPPARS